MKRLTTALLTATALVSSMVLTAPAAHAETNAGTLYSSCEGSIAKRSHIRNSAGTIMSTVQVWKKQEARGWTVCVRNVHQNSYYGKAMWTMVKIGGVYDRGTYSYYAGAIRTPFWKEPSVVASSTDPSVPERYYECDKVAGRTGDVYASPLWVCVNTQVSR